MYILYVCVVFWLLLKRLFHHADTTNRDTEQHYCIQSVVKKIEEVSELSIRSGHCQGLSVRLPVCPSTRLSVKRADCD